MRNTFILICMVTMLTNINSQEKSAHFTSNVIQGCEKHINKYNKIALHALEKAHSDIYESNFLIVHEFFSTRTAAKLCKNQESTKNKILSYVDVKSSEFGEAYVFSDSNLLGVIHRSPVKINTFDFYKNETSEHNNKNELIWTIQTIKPDLIFRIYNLPRTYWLIKEDELMVVSYENTNSEIKNLKTYKSEDYIKNILTEEDILFLTNKRVFVVSGR